VGAASVSDAGPTSAAGQVAPALVHLAQTADGTQRLTLHLEPNSLGHVQIQIDRPQDAAPRVDITVQRPQTLDLLLRDQPQLQHALDQAGVPKEGRTLTFHLASPDSGTSSGTSDRGDHAGTHGAAGGSGFSFGSNPGGNQGSNPGGSRFASAMPRNGGFPGGTAEPTAGLTPAVAAARQYRAGLDITA
jgi:hypothetical protein